MRDFWKSESGASASEYALTLAIIGSGLVLAATAFRNLSGAVATQQVAAVESTALPTIDTGNGSGGNGSGNGSGGTGSGGTGSGGTGDGSGGTGSGGTGSGGTGNGSGNGNGGGKK
jgi:Flp pilus assembly pilin Flp